MITRAYSSMGGPNFKDIETEFQNSRFKLMWYQRDLETQARIFPKKNRDYWFLVLRDHLKKLFFIFLFYQVLRSVLNLRKKFSFTSNLLFRVQIIAWAVLAYVGIQYLFDYILSTYYIFLSIDSYTTNLNHIDGLNFYMTRRYEFNIEGFILGLLLLVLYTLLKRASEIEKEWTLTI